MSVALLFPGQGAQAVGMGRGMVDRSATAKRYFEEASKLLGYDLLALCLEGPEEKLNATVYSQPALYVHSMAALAELRERDGDLDRQVSAVAGLSLGEYSALTAAGVISFEDGVRLVQARGAAMQDAADRVASGMASVLGLSQEQVEEVCTEARRPGEILQVANLLCPGNIAISGHVGSLDGVESIAARMGAMKTIRLAVAGAFHTELMRPAEERLSEAISRVEFRSPRVPVYSNVDGAAHGEAGDFQSLLPRQLVSPVQWEGTLRAMMAFGVTRFLEVGAGRVLAGTLKRIDRKISCECVGD